VKNAALALLVLALALVATRATAQVPSASASASAAPAPAPAPEGGAEPAPPPEAANAGDPLAEPEDLTTIPLGKGLPVAVRVAVFVAAIDSVDENESTFSATIDVRLRWHDPRLGFQAASATGGTIEYRGPAADARLEQIWSPDISIANLLDEPAPFQMRGLRVNPEGRVELMVRTKGKFAASFEMTRFPFDRQQLPIELVSRRDNRDRVALDYRQDDLNFSMVSHSIEIDGWAPGLLSLTRAPVGGWYGESHARVFAKVEVERQAGKTVAAIFIPLLASLLIPLLAMWLNRVEDGAFAIEAFELANIVIGGLFAVIALNFTVGAEYPALTGGDNSVTRLLGLNYMTLAIAVVLNLVMFRFNVVKRIFNEHVQAVLYHFFLWALPVLVFATAAAFIFVALA
jgi:hypothetical protein